MFADDLEQILLRHVEGFDQGGLDALRNGLVKGGRFALWHGNTDEWHDGPRKLLARKLGGRRRPDKRQCFAVGVRIFQGAARRQRPGAVGRRWASKMPPTTSKIGRAHV